MNKIPNFKCGVNMINRTKQNWNIGETVKVGFLSLKVTAIKGNEYFLVSSKGVEYVFTPYTGLNKL
jgi:hypothetical protein